MSITKEVVTVSVIIPCYNEEKNLERGVLNEVHQYLTKQSYSWEVIIVNDESTDNSRNLVQQFIKDKNNFFLFDILHGGKSSSIWAGLQHAVGKIVLFTDMDQSTPIHELDKLISWYAQGFDVVIGSREGNSRKGFSLLRKVGSGVFRIFRRLLLLRNIQDTQCGFKSCYREAALKIFPHLHFFKQINKPKGWKVSAYDVELLLLLEKAGYKIKEVTVEWYNRDNSNTKKQVGEKNQYFYESIEMAVEIMRVKLNQLQGVYDDI